MAAPEARRSPRFHHPVESRVKYKPPQDCITDQRTLHLEHKFNRSGNIRPKPKAIPNSRYSIMKILPDDLWLRIFKLGIDKRILDETDICSVAITCHHFDQITQEPDLWAALLAQNFLSSVLSDQHAASKALFRTEHKKMKENKREMEEMFDEVMEFVMWLDNNFRDQEETCMDDDDDASREWEHTDFDFGKEASEDEAHLTNADTSDSDTNRSNSAYPESFWTTISTILLSKRHYLYHQSRLGSEQN